MRKHMLILAIALAAVAVLALPAAAYANFAIHGNYVQDTDACAGCHRAHTSVSTITWTDSAGGDQHSALLVTSATQAWQFCYACHDGTSQGADTNVQDGIYEGTLYGTQGETLNGGGFDSVNGVAVSSTHIFKGESWGAYGGGLFGQGVTGATGQLGGDASTGESVKIKMECTTCHDPHGSANYRILKASVNGNYVGGYVDNPLDATDPNPDGYVSSTETGWPVNGFRLHRAYNGYQPNYTTAMYAKGYDMTSTVENPTKGMSGWCAGCHSTYLLPTSEFSKTDPISGVVTTYSASASMYNSGDGSGYKLRHRHPINVGLNTYNGPDKASMIVTSNVLPLAHDIAERGTPVNRPGDWIECLTCHRAHGTAAIMTGYAKDTQLPLAPGETGDASVLDTDGVSANNFVASESALLWRDNRGVCESCHNK